MFNFRELLLACGVAVVLGEKFQPTWESLDKRPLPAWYDEAKFGIFIHWGVFSVPSYRSEWFWNYWKGGDKDIKKFMSDNYPPRFTYQDFAKDFTAEFFDANQWADLFEASGARYIVLTSKHHEGYCLWPSKYSYSWNSMDVGPRRDLVGELAAAITKKKALKFGLYHSLLEWFNPLFMKDAANNFTTQDFVKSKSMPELYELINTYHPEVLWSDGDWGADSDYWVSKTFLAWLYNESPVKSSIVVNDRWGTDSTCKHGDFFNCMDRFSPGILQPHKWENCMTIDKHSWGFRRQMTIKDTLTMEEILLEFVKTVSCGGNLLLNVGPTKEGTISPIFQERLSSIGTWLQVNGKGIYGSKPWTYQNDTVSGNVWYTKDLKNGFVYAFSVGYPLDGVIKLGALGKSGSGISVKVMGWPDLLKYTVDSGALKVTLPPKHVIPTDWVYTLQIAGLKDISNEISIDLDHHFT